MRRHVAVEGHAGRVVVVKGPEQSPAGQDRDADDINGEQQRPRGSAPGDAACLGMRRPVQGRAHKDQNARTAPSIAHGG